jgi:transcriptional regulator with XRE-family HTH domain
VASGDPHRALCIRIIRLLREERERRGLSKYAVEQRTGVSQQMVGYVERGLRNPSLEVVLRMAAALEVDLGDLIKAAAAAGPTRKPKAKPAK